MKITGCTGSFSDNARRAGEILRAAGTVVVGAGAGLSTAAGYTYSGERFDENFADFRDKYGFQDMYSGGFYPYSDPREYWAYWSRYITINRYRDPPKPVYGRLLELLRGKDYFVVTTNVDHCFQRAGFDKERLFYTQGDYGLFQCSVPCRQVTFDNEETVRRMVAEQRDMKVPEELLPFCPWCGSPLTMNLRSDDKFAEDEGWHAARQRYEEFIERARGRATVYLELGVGYNTPGIIKFPFWRLVGANPAARYIAVNADSPVCPEEIAARSVLAEGNITEFIEAVGG